TLAVNALAAKFAVPDALAAGPEAVAVAIRFTGTEFWPVDERLDGSAIMGEREARRQIGRSLHVVGLQPVISVHVVGVLTNNGPHNVDGGNLVGRSHFANLRAQPSIVLEQLVNLGVLRLKRCLGSLCAPGGKSRDLRLLDIPV